MSQNIDMHENCSCLSCQQLSETEKKLHLEISQNSRREFFKNAGKLGFGIGIGGGLISPLAASALEADGSNYKEQVIKKIRLCKMAKRKCLPFFIPPISTHKLKFMMNFLWRTINLFIKKEVDLLC